MLFRGVPFLVSIAESANFFFAVSISIAWLRFFSFVLEDLKKIVESMKRSSTHSRDCFLASTLRHTDFLANVEISPVDSLNLSFYLSLDKDDFSIMLLGKMSL